MSDTQPHMDEEAQRYLRYHSTLLEAQKRAYSYLNQMWFNCTRSLTKELRHLGHKESHSWVESLSTSTQSFSGLRWHASLMGTRCQVELADVRHSPHLSGSYIGCTVSLDSRSARKELHEYLIESKLQSLLPETLSLHNHFVRYDVEQSKVFFLAYPLLLTEPRSDSKSLLYFLARLWKLLDQNQIPSSSQSTKLPSQSSSYSVRDQSSESSDSSQTYRSTSRYPSAAPPLPPESQRFSISPTSSSSTHQTTHQVSTPPHQIPPPQLPPEPTRILNHQGRPYTQDHLPKKLVLPTHQDPPPSTPSPSKSVNSIPDEPADFLYDHIPEKRSEPDSSLPSDLASNQSSQTQESQPNHVAINLNAEEKSTQDIQEIQDIQGIQETQTKSIDLDTVPSPSQSQPQSTASLVSPSPLSSTPSTLSTANDSPPKQTSTYTSSDPVASSTNNDVKPPSYIKSIQESLQNDQESTPPQINLDHLVSLLEQRGLKPWKVTASRNGQGTILWLQNGSYIDLTPEGEVILGGENQEQTRETLAPVGIHL